MKGIIIAVIVVLVLVCGGLTIGLGGFGAGNGSGSGDGNQILDNSVEEKKNDEPQDKEVVIKIEENKIYVGEEECADIEDLIDKISKINSKEKETKYIFEHEYAIKATYDEVKKTLLSLEENLEISIDYKE